MTGCKVTLTTYVSSGRRGGRVLDTCGLPVIKHGLCAKHLADRVRLGGAE